MNEAAIVRRETVISIAINMAISAIVFCLIFRIDQAAPIRGLRGFAFDFVPQSFMISLMGSLVPGLLTAAKTKARTRREVVLRAFAVAVIAALAIGGPIAAILYGLGLSEIDPMIAVALKVAFGCLLALLVTPSAVRHALRRVPASAVRSEA